MKNDRIVLFNQMTDGELSDCNKFKTILRSHYKKFYLLYNALLELDLLNNIVKIKCDKVDKHLIYFLIDMDTKYDSNDYNYIYKVIRDYLCEYEIEIDKINNNFTIKIKDINNKGW